MVRPFLRGLLAALLLSALVPAAAGALAIHDLGPASSMAWSAVNDHGEVVGYPLANGVPTIWQAGATRTVAASGPAAPLAVDDAGTLYGRVYHDAPSPAYLPDYWSPDGSEHPFATGGSNGVGYIAASPAGWAIRYTDTTSGARNPHVEVTRNAGTVFTLAGVDFYDISVNDQGDAVGRDRWPNASRPWISSGSAVSDLNITPAPSHRAINASEQVIGRAGTTPELRAPGGALTPLPQPAGATNTFPMAINDSGVIVGTDFGAGALIWRNGTVTRLDDLLPAGSGWHLTDAIDVSNTGYILGRGTLQGASHWFLIDGAQNFLGVGLDGVSSTEDGDFQLRVTLQHGGGAADPAIQALTVGAPAITPISGAVTITQTGGPLPDYVTQLAGGQSSQHVLGFHADGLGASTLQVTATGTGADGSPQNGKAAVRVDVGLRDPSAQDADALVAGALMQTFQQAKSLRDDVLAQLDARIRKLLAKRRGTQSVRTASTFERALAEAHGLPADMFAWLPDASSSKRAPTKSEIFFAFAQSAGDEFLKAGRQHLADTWSGAVAKPLERLRELVFEPKDGELTQFALAMAASVRNGAQTTGGYLSTAWQMWTDPAQRQAMWNEIPRIGAAAQQGILGMHDTLLKAVGKVYEPLAAEYRTDPRKAAVDAGKLVGKVDAALTAVVVQYVFARGGGAAAAEIDGARGAAGLTKAVDETGTVVSESTILGGEALAKATPLATNPNLGNLTQAQLDRFEQIVKTINDKFGVNIEIQARPINEFAQRVKNAIGKVEAVPTKNLTPNDVLLGAPEKWLGQTAYYKPQLPDNFAKLPADLQADLKLRLADKLEEWRMFHGDLPDPLHKADKVRKALKPGGAEVPLGTNGKLHLELAKEVDEDTGAILIQYKKLVINGRPAFTGKPRPIVSDIDFNAIVDAATGKNLPAGIRGQVELEVMRQFRIAAEEGVFPFGYHGWTFSGFDVTSADFRELLKYMLMYLPEDKAAAVARKYAAIYGVTPDSLLAGYKRGKLLVKITATGSALGPGAH